ncbi:MAG: hypothetical protein K8W52_40425 [Deltaproteobacteria bacterium]|nr:hypothetical protein [Deltaproteobacteria bacterium]
MHRWLVAWLVVGGGIARADGPLDDLPAARAIGRAGTGLVSDDGAGALTACPAGLARRDVRRGTAGLTAFDPDVTLTGARPAAPVIADQATGSLAPAVFAAGSVGRFVIGVGYATTAAWTRQLPIPELRQPPADVTRLDPHRYAGLSGSYQRRTLAAGLAVRISDTIAVGASLRLDRVGMRERRRAWAGYPDRFDDPDDASRDVDLELRADQGVVPGGALGVMIAPGDVPIELALGVAATAPAALDGTATATAAGIPTVDALAPTAAIDLPATVTARAGVRWLGERWALELGGELWFAPGRDAPVWTVRGVRVVDQTGKSAALTEVPSTLVTQAHGALRASLDVELAPGFAWLTAGYAHVQGATPRAFVGPAFADLGGDTGALGVELTAAGFTISAGWSRTFARSVDTADTRLTQVNPFGPVAAATIGTVTTTSDRVGVAVELALD